MKWKYRLAALLVAFLPSACYAAFAIFQTYAGPPQIFYNIITDGGASCPGDKQVVTRDLTTVNGSPTVSVSVDTFVGGDVGKLIILPGAGFGGNTRVTTISTVSAFAAGKQDITVAVAPQNTLTGVSTQITYGTDDAPKFVTFNTWARANQGASNQVVLTIPAGANCWFGTSNSISGVTLQNAFAAGINNLIVEGTGATIDGAGQLGGQGIIQIGIAEASGQSARVQSVSAGATQVTLTATSFAAGYISRFTTGRWIMLGGLDPQGLYGSAYGFPPNARYFEWRQITNVDSGTGTITLDRAITNSYLDTWPLWSAGSAFEADQGGPATIYALNDTWNQTVEYRGLTISQNGQIYAQSRNATYRNVTFVGGHAVPTQNETWSAYSSIWPAGTLETDKLVGTMLMDDVTVPRIDFQSSSTDLFILRNSNITTMFGTPTRAEITDTTFGTLRLGADKYGASLSTVCTRCAVTAFDFPGGTFLNRPTDFSMASGVISFLNTAAGGDRPAELVFVPPVGNVFWVGGGFFTVGMFNVQGMTQDATNAYVQTNEAGGLPSVSDIPAFRTHAAPQFTCDDCSGDPTLVATNIQRGATPAAPLYEFGSRDYAPTSAQGNLGTIRSIGKIVSLTVNVTQAYTGSGAAVLHATAQFDNIFTIKQSDWTTFQWGPQINLKQAGERIITPSGVTCDGVAAPTGCSGDTLGAAFPEAVWIQQGINPYMGSTLGVGTQPLVTITIRTDQGVVN